MTEGIRLLVAFALAAILTAVTTPAAIAIANRTGFLDSPTGYKAHLRPTPYLGGLAVLAAALPTSLIIDDGFTRYWPLLLGTVGLSLVGTVDDRVNLSPWLRVGAEVVAAWFLWAEGFGWSFLSSETGNLLLTMLWVTALVNAFNLMDNLDGAAASVATVSAASVVAFAVIGGERSLAVIAIGLCGSLIGFLRFNLARPARIFLGDGGSMAIGFLLAGSLMAVPLGGLSGWPILITATIAVGLPVFDTALVVLSRRRRRAPIFSGATDHTTHRLHGVLKSRRAVAMELRNRDMWAGDSQRNSEDAVVVAGTVALLVGATMIIAVDGFGWTAVSNDS